MIAAVLAWWLVSAVLGAAALPLAARLLGRLPDRGYGVSRALGLLAAGYVLWMGASLGVLHNNLAGALTAVVVVAGVGVWVGAGRWGEVMGWLRGQWRVVLSMEVVFAAAFGAWAFVRACNPDIVATEKPMELAFLNSILRSTRFPPPDPWLSGYAISYYYFGYVLLAFLARLTGTAAGMAFNLGNALWFGLTALGAYSLLFNLLAVRFARPRPWAAALGPLFILISGNLEGVLEVMHARHWFWAAQPDGTMTSRFWTWLALPDLNRPPVDPPSWQPTRFWMWWRASRVVNDYTLSGAHVEVIDEFPFFSFLLADNHPHVLALPFVFLAIAFTLQLYLSGPRGEHRLAERRLPHRAVWRILWIAAAAVVFAAGTASVRAWLGHEAPVEMLLAALKTLVAGGLGLALLGALALLLLGEVPSFLDVGEFWTTAWIFGGLAFLNTWDFPIYLSLLLIIGLWNSREAGFAQAMKRTVATAAALVAAGVLLYLPWYPTFASQAGGVLPNLAFPTRWVHLMIMFGTMLVPLGAWLIWRAGSGWREDDRGWALRIGLGLPLSLLLTSWLLALVVGLAKPEIVAQAVEKLGAASLGEAVRGVLVRRLTTSWTALMLGGIVALSVVVLRRGWADRGAGRSETQRPVPYLMVLSAIGGLLVLAPEFLYLRDLFETRMNTIFKFFFAAWLLWGVVAAYAAVELWEREGKGRNGLRALAILPLVMGLVYTETALWNKTAGFRPSVGRTLDGTLHLARENPDDYAAIQWLQANVHWGVIAEAVGGSYRGEFGRISAHTGLPTVLGWPWHEVQWRGGGELLGSREADIRHLYETPDWGVAQAIIDRYGIDYVILGRSERAAYPELVWRKFDARLQTVFESGEVKIYVVPGVEDAP